MKNSIKKHTPLIIGIILLLVIAILLYCIFYQGNGSDNTAITIPKNEVENTSGNNGGSTLPDTSFKYSSVLPKAPITGDKYLYEQYIEGNGSTILCNTIPTYGGIYVIGESTCINGDINARNARSVGIVYVDSLGTVSKSFTIPNVSEVSYITSALTVNGLVVICVNKAKTDYYVNVVGDELDSIVTFRIPAAQNAYVLQSPGGFFVLAEYAENNIIYSYKDGILNFKTIPVGKVVTSFELASSHLIFLTTDGGYTLLNIKKDLTVLSVTFVENYRLIEVVPLYENNEQKFICLESNNGVSANKYSLKDGVGQRTFLGNFNIMDVTDLGDKILIVARGQINGIVYLSHDLVSSVSSIDYTARIASILDKQYKGDSLSLLVRDIDNNLAIMNVTTAQNTITYLEKTSVKAFLTIFANGLRCVAYQTQKNSCDVIGVCCI